MQLPQVEVKDHPESEHEFELVDKVGGQSLILKAHRDRIKTVWLREIREYAKDHGENEESNSDEVASPPATPKTDQSSLEETKPQPKLPGELFTTQRGIHHPNIFVNRGVRKTAQQDSLVSELKLAVKKKSTETTLVEKKQAFTLGSQAPVNCLSHWSKLFPGSTSTTTDLVQSDTLKQILTPESEAIEPSDYHLKRIEAVEPLRHVHDPRRSSSSSSSDRTLVPEASEVSARQEEVDEGVLNS